MWILQSTLLLSSLLYVSADDNCTATGDNGYKITIVTHHNKSGHHIEQVVVDDSSGNPLSTKLWTMNVQIENTTCLGKNCALIRGDLVSAKGRAPPVDYVIITELGYGYKYHGGGRTWGEAKMICESEGTHLVIIDGELDRSMVMALYQRYDYNAYARNEPIILGFNDIVNEGDYRTVLGQSISCLGYSTWADGQPNPSAGRCGAVNGDGELMVIGCDQKLPFMCQWISPQAAQ